MNNNQIKFRNNFMFFFIIVLFNCFELSYADNIGVVSSHGILMTVGWVVFASTGILLVRYYSHFGRIVYIIHIVFAILVQLISIAGFLILFGYYFGWTWVATNSNLAFAHSIFGITAIAISLLQIISGIMHCRDRCDNHYISRYFHRFGGILAFVLASLLLFLLSVLYYFIIRSDWSEIGHLFMFKRVDHLET